MEVHFCLALSRIAWIGLFIKFSFRCISVAKEKGAAYLVLSCPALPYPNRRDETEREWDDATVYRNKGKTKTRARSTAWGLGPSKTNRDVKRLV